MSARTAMWGLLSLVLLVVALVVGSEFAPEGFGAKNTPLVATVLSIVPAVATALLAYLKADKANTKIDKLTNGGLQDAIGNAMADVSNPATPNPVETDKTAP